MKKNCKKIKAFTLAEMAVVFMILGLIATATFTITKSKSNYYLNKFMYYSAFNNLQKGIEELAAAGCSDDDLLTTPSPHPYCATRYSLPLIGHNGTLRGLCDRLAAEEFNTVGTIDCTKTITGNPGTFTLANANFTTTNGMRFFNFGSTPTANAYTVYIDIDGPKRNAILNEDVMKFNVYTNGTFLPAPNSIGANDANYLSASVKYWDSSINKYSCPLTSVSYREASCEANKAPLIDATYCSSTNSSPYPARPVYTNCSNGTYDCKLIIHEPGFRFGN